MFPRLPKLTQFLVLSPTTGTKTADNVSPLSDADKPDLQIQRLPSAESKEPYAGGFLKLGSDRS